MSPRTRTSSDAPKPASVKTLWMSAVRDSELGQTTRLVAWALATWMNSDGWCCPSVELIRKATKLGRSTVLKHLKILVKEGHLARSRGGGTAHFSQYQVLLKSPPMHGLSREERVHDENTRVHLDDDKSPRAGVQEVVEVSISKGVGGQSADAEPPPWAGHLNGWKGWRKELQERELEDAQRDESSTMVEEVTA